MVKKYINNRLFILYLIPFFIGLLTVLSFQPFNFTLINFIIFPLFFYLIVFISKKSRSVYRKKPYKRNFFLVGISFGFGFYLSGISWITNSLTFDESFKVLIPLALILIPLFLSLFFAFPILFIGPKLKFDFSSIIIFSGILAFSDYLRGKLFTGFPWNLWAYSTSWSSEILQILNFTGLYSYNLIVITLFSLPVIIFLNISKVRKMIIIFLIGLFILGLYIFGSFIINKNNKFVSTVGEKILIKIVSPNFDLEYGLTEKDVEQRLRKLIRYSDPVKGKKTLFVWPEGVFSGYSYNEILSFKELIKKNFSNDHLIIFGVNKMNFEMKQFYNSMLVVDNNFELIQSYNKRKLVPFGEFLPFDKFFNKFGLKKITEGRGSFLAGSKNKNIKIEKLNILPLICYEVIFTELIQKSDLETNIIINISEDGWFGSSIGPDQHFVKSIFRAIENNTFFIRSANKGKSAIIDNKGNIIKELNRNETGNLEFEVPLIKSKKIKNDLIFLTLLITYLFIFLIYRKKHEK